MGKVALLFPGQGSQQVGMGQAMALAYKKAQDIFDEANEVLQYDLASLCFEGPEDQLQLTVNTQPAILTTSIACMRIFDEANIQPDFVAGHSLGEYSALVAAESISFSDAVATVRKRGLYMEEAVPAGVGAMSAVLNMDREKLIEVCTNVCRPNYRVEPANFNCPGQIVISGHKEAVEEAGHRAREQGAKKVIPLPVSGPFHSSLMQPAADALEEALQEIRIQKSSIPVVTNVSAQPITEQKEISSALVQQVSSPVLWEDTVRYLIDQQVDTFIEIGNGEVLSRLIKKTDRNVRTFSIQDPSSLEKTVDMLTGGES